MADAVQLGMIKVKHLLGCCEKIEYEITKNDDTINKIQAYQEKFIKKARYGWFLWYISHQNNSMELRIKFLM